MSHASRGRAREPPSNDGARALTRPRATAVVCRWSCHDIDRVVSIILGCGLLLGVACNTRTSVTQLCPTTTKKKWQNNSQNGQILQDDKRVRVSASRLEKKRKRTATRHRKHVRRKSITTSSFFGTRVGGRKGRNTAKRASTKQQKISLTPSTSKRAGDLSFKIFSQRIYLEGGGTKHIVTLRRCGAIYHCYILVRIYHTTPEDGLNLARISGHDKRAIDCHGSSQPS